MTGRIGNRLHELNSKCYVIDDDEVNFHDGDVIVGIRGISTCDGSSFIENVGPPKPCNRFSMSSSTRVTRAGKKIAGDKET